MVETSQVDGASPFLPPSSFAESRRAPPQATQGEDDWLLLRALGILLAVCFQIIAVFCLGLLTLAWLKNTLYPSWQVQALLFIVIVQANLSCAILIHSILTKRLTRSLAAAAGCVLPLITVFAMMKWEL